MKQPSKQIRIFPEASRERHAVCVQTAQHRDVVDRIAEEVPIALMYNGLSHAVMMATPENLDDFAEGFSFSEGIVSDRSEIFGCETAANEGSIELRITLSAAAFTRFRGKRRGIVGRTGCGLCGVESIDDLPGARSMLSDGISVSASAIERAMAALSAHQPLNRLTGGCHAAAFASREGEILMAREDVGRHNALDKLIGALMRSGRSPTEGFAILSSRASFEMADKAARAGIPILAAVSAPTGLAIDRAEAIGLTLIAFARQDRFSIYAHPERITP